MAEQIEPSTFTWGSFTVPDRARIVSVAQMQEIERATDATGHSYAAMMERAGAAVADAVRRLEPVARGAEVLVLAGPGNNGGDGLVCARHLHEAGVAVRVYLWKRATQPGEDYLGHFGRLAELGVEAAHADQDGDFATLRRWLERSGVVVDALLGTGANRPIEGQLAALLGQVRQRAAALTVVAVDCPSGLDCDSGALDPHTLPARTTVAFAYAKQGHYRFPGAGAVGALEVADIGTDPMLAEGVRTFVLGADWVARQLPPRDENSHKGSFGKVMAVVGSANYPGAAYLSCAAAGRVGAGLVTGAVPNMVWPTVASRLAEATYLLLPSDMGVLSPAAARVLEEQLGGYDALLLGCGLTQEEATQDFVAAFLARGDAAHRAVLPRAFRAVHGGARGVEPAVEDGTPAAGSPFAATQRRGVAPAERPPLPATVIDADGLNCLARLEHWVELVPPRTVLTPHPAEMARLAGLEVADVMARRWQLALEMAAAWRSVLLLKGPYTVIAHPQGWLAVLPVATAALATAGTGDVLAGAVAGLLAQGLDPFLAACVGSWVHGQAGLLCQAEIGRAGVVAGDLLPRLPRVLAGLWSG